MSIEVVGDIMNSCMVAETIPGSLHYVRVTQSWIWRAMAAAAPLGHECTAARHIVWFLSWFSFPRLGLTDVPE